MENMALEGPLLAHNHLCAYFQKVIWLNIALDQGTELSKWIAGYVLDPICSFGWTSLGSDYLCDNTQQFWLSGFGRG
jgi:hypothetical protein